MNEGFILNMYCFRTEIHVCTECILKFDFNIFACTESVLSVNSIFSIVKMLKYTKNILFFNLDFYYTWKVY